MVFLAEDLISKQEVAIKCLTKPTVANSGSFVDDGTEELNCHNTLKSHPNLVNLICHFETETHNFLVLEYCSQGDLYEAIRLGKGPQSTDHVRRFMLQLITKADIWSIGICLLNILFQRNPFVQPSEDDKLFADYRRDRQSIFDVFPSMSQDTFEILSVAMALDPNKRDLRALRLAVTHALSFTTDDEALDDFCTEDRNVVQASAANREPLRTPSIQSPQIGEDSFPWAKALHTTPPRALSVIPDSYEEDLFEFEKMPKFGDSWVSGPGTTPSMASVFDSAYSSLHSVAIKSNPRRGPPRPDPVSIPNSLPIRSSRPIPAMSSIFGNKKDKVAKSWSEIRTPRPMPAKSSAPTDENTPVDRRGRTPRRSIAKTVPLDKWEALGDRRRNRNEPATRASMPKKRAMTTVSNQKPPTVTFDHWHRRDSRLNKHRPAYLDQDWRHQRVTDSAESEDDHEWVGGWQRWDNLHL
ncbi:hypothetical protein DV738_g1020, partial [Chaetothyriales sp. CBS 135597]